MRVFKLLTTSLILAVIWLFIWQNVPVFKTLLPFTLDLYVHEQLTWSHQLYTLLLFAGGLGFLFGILVMLKPYFSVRRLLAQARQERERAGGSQQTPPPKEETFKEEAQEKTVEGQ